MIALASTVVAYFTGIVGFFVGIGFTCDKYIRSEFKKQIWQYMVDKPRALALRDIAKAYLQHTAFRLFSCPPLSWHSFSKSAYITVMFLTVLYIIYCILNGLYPASPSIENVVPYAMLILGAIIMDYLSVVLTLYIMHYAQSASHFLELAGLFVADIILTINLFGLVFAFFLALTTLAVLYTPRTLEVYIHTRAVQPQEDGSLGSCFPDESWQHLPSEVINLAIKHELGVFLGCATVYLKTLGAPGGTGFSRHNFEFLSRNVSTDHVASALFENCSPLDSRIPESWHPENRSGDDTQKSAVYGPARYKCETSPIRSIRLLLGVPRFYLYYKAYDYATVGQRALSYLMIFGRVEFAIMHEADIVILNELVGERLHDVSYAPEWFVYDHGKTRGTMDVESARDLCAECLVMKWISQYSLSTERPHDVIIPVPVFFLSSFFLTIFFYSVMFVVVFFCTLLGQAPRALLLIDRFTTLADYPFTLVFTFAGMVFGVLAAALAAASAYR